MGKGKRKGGLTGLSRFVLESFRSEGGTSSTALSTAVTHIIDHNQENETSTELPNKKRKVNIDKPEEWETKNGWVKKYDATGRVPHFEDASEVPDRLQKYFFQRYRLLSLYSEPPGCLLDEEGWFSITPERIADQIAERCRCDTILDAFCGVGGNAIAFAKTCQRVIALDTSSTRLALARHNAQIYGVADRIEFILADYIAFAEARLSQTSSNSKPRKIDVVFLSPPWGGPAYLSGLSSESTSPLINQSDTLESPSVEEPEHPLYTLSSIQPIHGADLFHLSRKLTPNVAFYVPRNTKVEEISDLLKSRPLGDDKPSADGRLSNNRKEFVEVEEEWMGSKLKALTCYFGGLAGGQENLF